MGIEDYKKIIDQMVEASEDIEYIIAVYTFADSYPDKSKIKNPPNAAVGF